MNRIEDITRKRSILLTTRMRFSPQIQPVKESAIEKIVERILFVLDTEEGLSFQKIQDSFSRETGGYTVSSNDMKNSLQRMVTKKKELYQKQRVRLSYIHYQRRPGERLTRYSTKPKRALALL